jgi:outer membrane lipoprotein carrier protein
MRFQGSARLQAGVVIGWLLCLLRLGVCGAPTDPPGLILGGDELVARVQSRYERTTHLHAHFTQETRVPGFDQPQTGAGQLWMLKPGMMRWDYTAPERQSIIANGDTLWIYTPAERQAIREQVNQALGMRTPALFLAGEARLTELFTVGEASTRSPSAEGLLQLQLIPKVGSLPYTQVQLGIDPVSYLVRRVQLVDPIGNMTTMWFSDLDTEGTVAPSLFQFQVPPGVDVIAPPVFPMPR